jgi:MFS family permease
LTRARSGDFGLLLPGGAAVLLLITGFLVYEARHASPVLQPRLFRRRSFAAATATIGFSNLAMYTTLLALPIVLARLDGWNEVQIGFVLTAMSAASVIFTPLGGRLADRWGRRWPAVMGAALFTVGLATLAWPATLTMLPVLFAGLGLAGVGMGLSSPGLQTAAIESVAADESGVAAGVYSTGRYLGSITGSSLLGGLMGPATAGTDGFGVVALIVVAAALLSTVLSLGLHHRPGSPVAL